MPKMVNRLDDDIIDPFDNRGRGIAQPRTPPIAEPSFLQRAEATYRHLMRDRAHDTVFDATYAEPGSDYALTPKVIRDLDRALLKPELPEPEVPEPEVPEIYTAENLAGNFVSNIRNAGSGILKISPTVIEMGADLARLATGDHPVPVAVSDWAKNSKRAITEVVGSDELNAQTREFDQMMQDPDQSIGDMVGFVADNPAIAIDKGFETIGSILMPLGAVKGVDLLAKVGRIGNAGRAAAATATKIGTTAAQNAASTFVDLEKHALDDRYKGAAVSSAISLLTSIGTHGIDGVIARKLIDDLQAGRIGLSAVNNFLRSVGVEAVQGAGEEAGNIIGQAVGSGEAIDPNNAGKRVTFAGGMGAASGGVGNLAFGTGGGAPAGATESTAPSAAPVQPVAPAPQDSKLVAPEQGIVDPFDEPNTPQPAAPAAMTEAREAKNPGPGKPEAAGNPQVDAEALRAAVAANPPVTTGGDADNIGRAEISPQQLEGQAEPVAEVRTAARDADITPGVNTEMTPAAEAAQTAETVMPAPAAIGERAMQIESPTPGLRPGDIVAADGKPFPNKSAAGPAAKDAGEGWRVVKGGGGFVVRHQPQSDVQIASIKRPQKQQNQVDTDGDSLFAAIAKLGGIRTDQLTKEWGFDPKEIRTIRGAGTKRISTKNGMSLDRMGEALAELGYLSYDQHGKHDLSELFDLFDGELRGSKHYTPQGYERAYRQAEAVRREELSQADIEASGLDDLSDDARDATEELLDDYPTIDQEEDARVSALIDPAWNQPVSGMGREAQQTAGRAAQRGDGSAAGANQEAPPESGTDQRTADVAGRPEGIDGVRLLDVSNAKGESRADKGTLPRGSGKYHSRGKSEGFGLSVDQIKQAIAVNPMNTIIDVYASMDDLPYNIKRQAEREGMTDVEGFYDDTTNRVALVAPNLASPQRALQVARYELIGHYGIENMLADPGKMKRLIARVIQAERDGNKVIADMAKRVDKTQPGIDAERRAKEIITVMTERNVQNAVTKRVLDAIRKFLDKLDVIKSDTTDADIAEMLRKAHSYLRESGRSLM